MLTGLALLYHCTLLRMQAGTTLTATAGAWNAISGNIRDNTSKGISITIENLPEGQDAYIDDVQITRCALEDFRYQLNLLHI
jgi:hypothetical protein